MKRNLRKLLLTRVYNGPSTTIFCVTSVTRRLLDTTTNVSRSCLSLNKSTEVACLLVFSIIARTLCYVVEVVIIAAIYNFVATDEYGLSLDVGDAVNIIRQSEGNYAVYLNTLIFSCIFPSYDSKE